MQLLTHGALIKNRTIYGGKGVKFRFCARMGPYPKGIKYFVKKK